MINTNLYLLPLGEGRQWYETGKEDSGGINAIFNVLSLSLSVGSQMYIGYHAS